MIFSIEVSETNCKVLDIEADTVDDAVDIVSEQYKAGDIVLDSSDFVDYEITPI